MVVQCHIGNSFGRLQGHLVAEFYEGVSRFVNLSIDHEGKGYSLKVRCYAVPISQYQFAMVNDQFEVKERKVRLVILQQPGTILT